MDTSVPKWANPFRISRKCSRLEAVAQFESWLRGKPDLLSALGELSGKVLLCHCGPLACCHDDVLRQLWMERFGLQKEGLWRAWQVHIDNLDVLEVATPDQLVAEWLQQFPPEVAGARLRYNKKGYLAAQTRPLPGRCTLGVWALKLMGKKAR